MSEETIAELVALIDKALESLQRTEPYLNMP